MNLNHESGERNHWYNSLPFSRKNTTSNSTRLLSIHISGRHKKLSLKNDSNQIPASYHFSNIVKAQIKKLLLVQILEQVASNGSCNSCNWRNTSSTTRQNQKNDTPLSEQICSHTTNPIQKSGSSVPRCSKSPLQNVSSSKTDSPDSLVRANVEHEVSTTTGSVDQKMLASNSPRKAWRALRN